MEQIPLVVVVHSGDNWVGEYEATRYFPAGEYVFNIEHDDQFQLFVDGEQKLIRSGSGSSTVCPAFHLEGDVDLKFLLWEWSGDARIGVTWSDDTSACNDITPPIGEMILPEINTHTKDDVLLAANASDVAGTPQDSSGVERIDFYAKSDNGWNGGAWTQVGSGLSDPYQYTWNTTLAPEGYYFLSANVVDIEGNESGILADEQYWTYVTVDRTPPTARILPLDTQQSAFEFAVAWEASDNFSQRAELNHSVQYQVNCVGNWNNWIVNKPITSAKFSGIPGQSYCFRVQAIDLADNVGNWSASSGATELPQCNANEFLAEYYGNKTLTGSPELV